MKFLLALVLCSSAIFGFINGQRQAPIVLYYIQHAETKLFIGQDAKLGKSRNMWGFRHLEGQTFGRLASYDTGKVLDISGGCWGTKIGTYRDNQAENQKFYFYEDGTIRSKCDTNKVIAPDKDKRGLILETFERSKLARYVFKRFRPGVDRPDE
ncbi:uncharacterized protein LOC132704922 [Cylas formicarius]|uniref:uncharacterized protein LOC132704922 n=1 Tax=Cylas formicarius TaxID=197179 RepID=UPI0029588E5C|nr:uncharacterized protein LOC132704922 [Cylas formicarius]